MKQVAWLIPLCAACGGTFDGRGVQIAANSSTISDLASLERAEQCHDWSERQYWFGGIGQAASGAAAASAGLSLPVKGDTARIFLVVGAGICGGVATGSVALSQSAASNYVANCR